MSDVWERSLALIGEQGALPVFARVHQGGKDLPLHQAVRALEPILFTAGVAEFIFCYSEFKLNGAAGPTYSPDVLRQFEADILHELRGRELSFLDFSADERAKYSYLFDRYLRLRRNGAYLASDSETLRVTVVEFFRENPWVFKLIAGGSAAAMIWLSVVFGGVDIAQQADSPQCRAEAAALLETRSAMIMRQAKLEGRMTDADREALKDISNSYNVAVAACQPRLPQVKMTVSARGVEIDFGPAEDAGKKDG
ncbi:hypothetical protein [Phenylobacterium sp.]|uniref:hypothetical protein n=1 Tax=Phenylobacterium sp. TaxID=1871053 RepID=UPI002F3FFEA0